MATRRRPRVRQRSQSLTGMALVLFLVSQCDTVHGFMFQSFDPSRIVPSGIVSKTLGGIARTQSTSPRTGDGIIDGRNVRKTRKIHRFQAGVSRTDAPQSLSNILHHFPEVTPELVNDLSRANALLRMKVSPSEQLSARSFALRMADATKDPQMAQAALLYKAYMEERISHDDLTSKVPPAVAELVEHCSQMIQLYRDSQELLWSEPHTERLLDSQSANLQNMLITMAQDWRVVTLVLAQHSAVLENLIDLSASQPALERATYVAARQALDVYAPLAHRLGMYQLKSELEDNGFRYLYPKEHKQITREVEERFSRHEVVLDEQIRLLKQNLVEDPLFINNIKRVSVVGRSKEPYSIWKKMVRKGVSTLEDTQSTALDQILDHIALRVIFEVDEKGVSDPEVVTERGEQLCYHAMEAVHKLWPNKKGNRVKDYIKSPKSNGYQSLHTTVVTRHHGQEWPFEVQVRTEEMHRVAEWGKAAHAVYKSEDCWSLLVDEVAHPSVDKSKNVKPKETVKDNYLPLIFPDIPASNGKEYAGWLHNELSESHVFVFYNDKIWDLARGITVKDAVLKKLGKEQPRLGVKKALRSIRINGGYASPDYQLRNGDFLHLQ